VSASQRREAETSAHYRTLRADHASGGADGDGVVVSTTSLTKQARGPDASFWIKTALAGALVVLLTATGLVASRKPADAATLALPTTPAMALSSSLLLPLETAQRPTTAASPLADTKSPPSSPGQAVHPHPTQETPAAEPSDPPTPGAVGILPDGRVVLNAASEDDLRKLPRVGSSRARSILALRAKLGKFRSVNDLLRVKGIGRKTLERMKPKLVVDAPPPEAEKTPPSGPS
jgi:competence protein ComEA